MRILVVEDNDTLRALMLKQLETLGYCAAAVGTAVEALEKLLREDFDLVLMDISLPQMDGLEASRRIRSIEEIARQKRIPIVATTGFSNRRDCLEAGIDDFLEKPIVLDRLRAVLDRWLKGQELKDKLVLVVEDDATNRRVISYLLEQMGITYHIARNGVEAVSKVRETEYALILMDIKMPGLDGYRATKAIRAFSGKVKDVPIVAVTAQAMDGDLEKCIWAGMNDYLPKPFTREDLELVVSRWLR